MLEACRMSAMYSRKELGKLNKPVSKKSCLSTVCLMINDQIPFLREKITVWESNPMGSYWPMSIDVGAQKIRVKR